MNSIGLFLVASMWSSCSRPPSVTFGHLLVAFPAFLAFNRGAVTTPRVHDFFRALRLAAGPSVAVGAAGYCWGGYYAVHLADDAERVSAGEGRLVDACFTAHPSFLNVPADAEKAKLPLSVIVGDVDLALPADKAREMKDVLERKDRGEGRYEMVQLEGAKHGFAVRGNPEDEAQMRQAQVAEDQAVEWFKKWLK